MDAEAPKIPHTPLTFPLLPLEMRLLIITAAAQHSPRGHLAAVSKEWQPLIEEKTFASLVVDKDQLYWLDFFRELSEWGEGDLTLEINAYSPSDSEHFFKGYYVGDPAEDEAFGDPRTFDDQTHGFSPTGQSAPQERDTREVYALMTRSIHFLDRPRVVKRLLIRRQCRRQFAISYLSLLFKSLPALEHIHYEPWRMSDEEFQDGRWYHDFAFVLDGPIMQLSRNLKTLILFEDFNRVFFPDAPASTRIPHVQFARALVKRSHLEHLSASFMVDAQDFFNADRPLGNPCRWEKLEFLALTSRLLDPEDKNSRLTNLLCAAGEFALRTPRLRTMILWYGNKNKAYAFIYKRDDTSITWHGTREFYMNHRSITEI
ncbi:hypothetical protein Neosp_001744 [[Neocosmospora] mangrovei]